MNDDDMSKGALALDLLAMMYQHRPECCAAHDVRYLMEVTATLTSVMLQQIITMLETDFPESGMYAPREKYLDLLKMYRTTLSSTTAGTAALLDDHPTCDRAVAEAKQILEDIANDKTD